MSTAAPIDERLAAGLAARGLEGYELALVLGSGLGAFVELLDGAIEVPFTDVDGMLVTGVPGHRGRFVLGGLDGVRVLVQQGRVHRYEGWSPLEVTTSVRAFRRAGCRGLVLTNAAGSLVRGWPVPCLMRITDHLNLQPGAALRLAEQGRGSPYDGALGEALDAAAEQVGIELRSGVYAGLLGPAYESAGEVRLLGELGAQAVGMSTVAEASAAHAVGMRVTAVSCIANAAAGLSEKPLSHADVLSAGESMAQDFNRLLAAAVPRIATALR